MYDGKVFHKNIKTKTNTENFSFCTETRRAQKQAKKKEKYREWMTSLYTNHENKNNEKDIDNLVTWAENLDFNDYSDKWSNFVTLPKV